MVIKKNLFKLLIIYPLYLENAGADKEKFTHLTNNAIQKNHPNYKLMKEDTIWSMIKFENYCIKNLYKTGKNMDDLYHKIK